MLAQAIEANPPVAPVAEQSSFGAAHPESSMPNAFASSDHPEDMPWDATDTMYADYCDDTTMAGTDAAALLAKMFPQVPQAQPAPQAMVNQPQTQQAFFTPATASPQTMQQQAFFTPATAPPQTMQQQAFFTPASGPAPMSEQAPQQGPIQVHQDNGFTPEQTKAIVLGVYQRCVDHFFSYCGRPQGFPNFEAAMTDGGPNCNVHNIYLKPLMLTEQEKAVIVKMDCYDVNGRWCPNMSTATGELRGWITKNTKAPMYKVYINAGGFEVIRTIMPVNPMKGKNAAMAAAGNRMAYVFDGIDKAPGQKGDLKLKFENGAWAEITSA